MSWTDYVLPSGQLVQHRAGQGFDIVGTDATISEADARALGEIAAGLFCKANGCRRFKGDGKPLCGAHCFARNPDPDLGGSGQSGGTISEPECGRCGFSPCSCLGGPRNLPLPDRTGGFPHVRMCVEGNAWDCNGVRRFGCSAEGCKGPDPLPDALNPPIPPLPDRRTGGISRSGYDSVIVGAVPPPRETGPPLCPSCGGLGYVE